jgi:hypothetical protein
MTESIRRLCVAYRQLFSSDEEMAAALNIGVREAQAMINGQSFPTLAVMIDIQATLRKSTLAAERGKITLAR